MRPTSTPMAAATRFRPIFPTFTKVEILLPASPPKLRMPSTTISIHCTSTWATPTTRPGWPASAGSIRAAAATRACLLRQKWRAVHRDRPTAAAICCSSNTLRSARFIRSCGPGSTCASDCNTSATTASTETARITTASADRPATTTRCSVSPGSPSEENAMNRRWAAALPVLLLASGVGRAEECHVTVEGNDLMQYQERQLTVPATCAEVVVTLKHIGTLAANVMGHNWVLAKSADVVAVANSGLAA